MLGAVDGVMNRTDAMSSSMESRSSRRSGYISSQFHYHGIRTGIRVARAYLDSLRRPQTLHRGRRISETRRMCGTWPGKAGMRRRRRFPATEKACAEAHETDWGIASGERGPEVKLEWTWDPRAGEWVSSRGCREPLKDFN